MKEGESKFELEAIEAAVEQIWADYDKDGSGHLSKDEAFPFITATLNRVEEGVAETATQEDYNQCFAQFDVDNNGTISRGEMAHFIKKLLGG